MNRKSLSTSLGSWYIQLVYSPERRGTPASERASSLPLLYLPPYLALILGIGAGCQALAHYITLGSLTAYLMSALTISVVLSYGARVAPPKLQRVFAGMRWPFALMLFLLAVSSRSSSLLPAETDGEGNSMVAVLVGFTCILSVLMVGARSGGRTVPLSAPLVPGLSLFGLLSLVSVDTVIQSCFLLFVISSLYILAYERFLRRYVANGEGPPHERLRSLPSVAALTRWSSGALLVCSVWFGLFMLGGAIFYYPVQNLLPRLVSPQINKMRAAAQGTLMDFRGSSAVMELRGGTYVLSDREVMRITVQSGESTGLWRGRVYDRYERSRWAESETLFSLVTESAEVPNFSLSMRARRAHSSAVKPPPLDPTMGRYAKVIELVEPSEGASATVYASGLVESRRERPDMATNLEGNYDYLRATSPYLVVSQVIRPQIKKLEKAPFVNQKAVSLLPPSSEIRTGLKRPDDVETRRTLAALAQQVKLGTSTPITGPHASVRAISDFLIDNCTYSLSSPTVPATRDAVLYFLTTSQTGACDMFASSMALLLREFGVPSRVVTGYLQPESRASSSKAGARPSWVLREKDAHAWVEYYVSGLGWLAYDPTSGTRLADDSISGQLAEFFAVPTLHVPVKTLLLPGAGLLLLMVGLFWSVLEKRFGGKVQSSVEEQDRARITQAYRKAVQTMRGKVPHHSHFTARDYDDRISKSTLPIAVRQEFAALTILYSQAQFQEHPPQVATADLEASVQRIRLGCKQKH